MNPKEQEIHTRVEQGLTNLLDRIDLVNHHISSSNEDYHHHVSDLHNMKSKIKKILNKDFDSLAVKRKS